MLPGRFYIDGTGYSVPVDSKIHTLWSYLITCPISRSSRYFSRLAGDCEVRYLIDMFAFNCGVFSFIFIYIKTRFPAQ